MEIANVNFALIAPWLRTTDMQSTAAMQFPSVCPEFLEALKANPASATEHVVLRSMGFGTRGCRMPSIPLTERARLTEVIRTSLMCHVYGDQLCRPHGGGSKRSRGGELLGVRAGTIRGLPGSNLRAFLTGADAMAALRDRYPDQPLSYDAGNTNSLEGGFSLYTQLCGGCMYEISALESVGVRLDCLDMVLNEEGFHMEKRKKGGRGSK